MQLVVRVVIARSGGGDVTVTWNGQESNEFTSRWQGAKGVALLNCPRGVAETIRRLAHGSNFNFNFNLKINFIFKLSVWVMLTSFAT
jgi:hypothetical protein